VSADARIRVPGGALFDVEVGYGPMTAPDNNRVLVYMRDITEGKRLREQLLQAEKMTMMGRLAAGIAHEIRNPLSALTLNLQYLVQKLDPQAPLHEYAAEGLEGARRVDTVVESTLALARVTPPLLQRRDLNSLVVESIGFLRFSLRQKGVTLETDLAPDLPAVMADAKQLEQAVLNVVQNAIDATPENGRVTVSTAHGPGPDERVVLAVRDSGAGISPDLRDRLFEDFFTTKAGGTGIGLALSKQIVVKHHGQIQVDTAAGGGTIIRIVLPVHAA
jgi:signal transduction histidine kinase